MFSALGGEIGKAYTELSPTVQLGKTISEQGGISGVLGSMFEDAKQIGKDFLVYSQEVLQLNKHLLVCLILKQVFQVFKV
jgi:hypothetical protein